MRFCQADRMSSIWVWKVDVPCKLDSFQTRLALRRVLAWCAKTCVETVTAVHGTTCDFRVRSGLLPSRQGKRWGIGILRRGLLQKRDGKEFTKQVHLPCDDVFFDRLINAPASNSAGSVFIGSASSIVREDG